MHAASRNNVIRMKSDTSIRVSKLSANYLNAMQGLYQFKDDGIRHSHDATIFRLCVARDILEAIRMGQIELKKIADSIHEYGGFNLDAFSTQTAEHFRDRLNRIAQDVDRGEFHEEFEDIVRLFTKEFEDILALIADSMVMVAEMYGAKRRNPPQKKK